MEIHPHINKNGLINQLELNADQIQEGGFKEGGIWFSDTQTIICGTFPPKKEYHNRKGYIHYSSPKNKFWQHIDALFQTEFFLTTEKAKNENLRIQNALDKIEFLKKKKFGFIDIFTKINREDDKSSKDDDLIKIETIFENGTFEKVLESNVNQFAFVYKRSRDEFMKSIAQNYQVKPILVRKYRKDNVTLEVKKIRINEKIIHLSYSPIHGNIRDNERRPALKKVVELDFE